MLSVGREPFVGRVDGDAVGFLLLAQIKNKLNEVSIGKTASGFIVAQIFPRFGVT